MKKIRKKQNTRVMVKESKPLLFIDTYKRIIGISLGTIIGIALISIVAISLHQGKLNQASYMFSQSSSAESYQTVVEDFKNTPYAPLALLILANELYAQNNIQKSEAVLLDFCKRYSEHVLLPQAKLGIAACAEAQENYKAEIRGLKNIISTHTHTFWAQQAQERIKLLQVFVIDKS